MKKSTMKAALCFVVFAVGSVLANVAGECHMAAFYADLGCSPVPHNSTCPESFTCPDYQQDEVCYYRGVPYGDEDYIPQSQILSSCSQSCFCTMNRGHPNFQCDAIDCPHDYDWDQGCVRTYDLMDSCCSLKSVCNTEAIAELASLATCYVDGETYYAGQKFKPSNARKTCICTADWDGQVDNRAYCRDVNCGLEIHYQSEIRQKCAPVFYGRGNCASEFECPSGTPTIRRSLNNQNIDAECVFGGVTLRVGDEVSSSSNNCTRCSCKIPPFVSCENHC